MSLRSRHQQKSMNPLMNPLKWLGQWLRLIQIFYIWLRYGLDEIVFSMPWLTPFKFIAWLNPLYWTSHRKLTKGERLCRALESLGPLFIKFGQILSTRRDFLPDEIADALSKLQDRVKPFDSALAIKSIEKSLKKPLSHYFSEFDPLPLASASIAQVHEAKLLHGQSVVIKVLRPQIRKIIQKDINLMYRLAGIAERTLRITRRLRAIDIVQEIERTILEELDLMREGANAVQIKRNNQDCPWLKIPEIYWDYSSTDVLVMEKITGIPIADIQALKAAGINRALLAERIIHTFYHQAFNDCFFHADMHPGNIFVSQENPDDPILQLVDFGIVGSLDAKDQHYLAANFLAFFKQDYRRVAELHIECGWVPQRTRVDEFESAMRAVCEPIFDKPLKEISLGQTLMGLIHIAQRFDMIIQPQLLLLQKTLWNIEGIGRTIYPDLDIWRVSKPFLENWMKQQIGFRGLFKKIKYQWPSIAESLPMLPELIFSLLKGQREKLIRERIEQEHQFEIERYGLHSKINPRPHRSLPKILLGLGLGVFTLGFLNQAPSLEPWIIAHPLDLMGIGIMVGLFGIFIKGKNV